jgi:hypothetical protein
VKEKKTHGGLFLLLLGLGRLVRLGGGGVGGLGSVAVCLSLRDLPGNSLAATPAGSPLCFLLLLLLVLLFGGLCDLDDDLTTVEFLLVQGFDGLLGGLCGGQRDKAISCGARATQDDLGRDTGRVLASVTMMPANAVRVMPRTCRC